MTIVEGLRSAPLLKSHYTSMRTEAAFTTFYLDTLKSSKDQTNEPIVPRQQTVPRRFDGGTHPHGFKTSEERYRQAYLKLLTMHVVN